MTKDRQARSAHTAAPAEAKLPDVMMATVDTLPEAYEVVGMVEATLTARNGVPPTQQLLDGLAYHAAAMGAPTWRSSRCRPGSEGRLVSLHRPLADVHRAHQLRQQVAA
jgi:hypothetical protein